MRHSGNKNVRPDIPKTETVAAKHITSAYVYDYEHDRRRINAYGDLSNTVLQSAGARLRRRRDQ